ncbi:hypothetical protein [Hyphobacterium marinum]|uniref:Lipoprotein n=1 Tax=Hyphobacterium marinum TaxID=3116574 RepID=A0ABU7LZN8_9PROT|nr:hypothetical protein [Hyphobacterium sp. Y6023]MEE2566650.1 hypothetical protein [Hyphobacterium sp. Y6023]
MARIFAILLPVFAAACAVPDLPGGPAEDPRWYDARVAGEEQATEAPDTIPALVITPEEEAARAASQAATLAAGDAIRNDDRASAETDYDTDSYAEAARERANPPARPD